MLLKLPFSSLFFFHMREHEGEQVKREGLELLCGPVIKNLSANNAGDMGSFSSRGTKIPQAVGQLSLCLTAAEPLL